MKIGDILIGGLVLGIAYIAYENRDKIISILKGEDGLGGLVPKPKPDGNTVAPDNLPPTSVTTPSYTYSGDSWSSSSWTHTKRTVVTKRSQKVEWLDLGDKRVCIIAVGDGGYKTNGDGTFNVTGSSPRIMITGNWTNVEETVYFYNTGKGNIDLRPKTDHYCNPKSKFGGYIININMVDNKIGCRKEIQHGIPVAYSKRINEKTVSLSKNTWIGLRGVAYNVSNDVKLEGWLDTGSGFKKITETVDTGNMLGKPHTAACGASAIRTNEGAASVKYKDWTVKEIRAK